MVFSETSVSGVAGPEDQELSAKSMIRPAGYHIWLRAPAEGLGSGAAGAKSDSICKPRGRALDDGLALAGLSVLRYPSQRERKTNRLTKIQSSNEETEMADRKR